MSEYYIRLEAYQLQRVAKQQELADLAIYHRLAKATNKKGTKYIYKDSASMFKSDDAIDEIRSNFEADYVPQSNHNKQLEYAKEANRRMKEWRQMHERG